MSNSTSAPPPSTSSSSPPPASSPPPTTSAPPPSSPPPSPPSPPPPSSTTPSSPPPQSPPPKSPPASSPPPPTPTSSPPPQSPPNSPSPPPPSSSNSSPSPPTPNSSPPPPAASSPPPPSSKSSKSPPPPSSSQSPHSPPPPSSRNSNVSPPPSPGESLSPPPPDSPSTSPSPPDSPSTSPSPPGTPPTATSPTASSPPPPASNSSQDGTSISPPPPATSSESNTSSGTGTAVVAGGVIAGVVVIALVAILFIVCRRNKRRRPAVYASPYLPTSNPPKPEVYYHSQQQVSGHSGSYYGHHYTNSGSSGPFGSQPMHSYSSPQGGNNFGNQGYQVGTPEGLGGSKSMFSYEELMEITNGFSKQNILGEGGFGCVYKGWLSDGKAVAVKELKTGSGQGEREFRAEVEVISRVHHRHLLSMVGYCISEHHRLLIYEFVSNKTLEHHLHGKGMPVLDWSKRLKIAIGSARGLAYLHEDCHPKIIHRDIKTANILLEDSFEAQVADFGLAKLSNDAHTHVSTRVMGTFGYLAPEYASSGKLTDRSDVFSFGVVLLELITGRKPVDASQPLGDESLVEWARPLLARALETGDLSELVDPRLENQYVESEMFRMIEAAAACVRHSAPKRPRMMQVARSLDSESESSDLSNGVKFGQSTIYSSGQYNQDISKFRKLAFGSGGESSEFDMHSGDYSVKEASAEFKLKCLETSSSQTSTDSETQAINRPRKSNFELRY